MVLLDLERMRAGRLYQRAASPDTMAWLSHKYEYIGSVGDQVRENKMETIKSSYSKDFLSRTG